MLTIKLKYKASDDFQERLTILRKQYSSVVRGKISKEKFQENRLNGLTIFGEKANNGNRKFKLNLIDGNELIFKLNRKEHFVLNLPKLYKNYKRVI